jgi:hypothetical protein
MAARGGHMIHRMVGRMWSLDEFRWDDGIEAAEVLVDVDGDGLEYFPPGDPVGGDRLGR